MDLVAVFLQAQDSYASLFHGFRLLMLFREDFDSLSLATQAWTRDFVD